MFKLTAVSSLSAAAFCMGGTAMAGSFADARTEQKCQHMPSDSAYRSCKVSVLRGHQQMRQPSPGYAGTQENLDEIAEMMNMLNF